MDVFSIDVVTVCNTALAKISILVKGTTKLAFDCNNSYSMAIAVGSIAINEAAPKSRNVFCTKKPYNEAQRLHCYYSNHKEINSLYDIVNFKTVT